MNCQPNVHNALVYDIGSAAIHGGHAGNMMSEIIFPSVACQSQDGAFVFDESAIYSRTTENQLAQIVDDQYEISDPALLSKFLEFSHERMGIAADERQNTSVLYTQPAHLAGDHNRRWQNTLTEVSLEVLGHKGVSIVSDAVLATYAHCAQTALVVDFGWSSLRVIPVIEGQARTSAIRVHPIGGYTLSKILSKQLEKRSVHLVPRDSKGNIKMLEQCECVNMLAGCCSYAENTIDEDFLYFLDGRPLDVQFEMKLVAAIHFNELKLSDAEGDIVKALPALIKDSIDACPDDVKRQMWGNIVSAGGFSRSTGFLGRLQTELSKVADPTFTVKVQFPMADLAAGRNTVWVGGSIFASCERVFDRFCVTADEWREAGEAVLKIKCVG